MSSELKALTEGHSRSRAHRLGCLRCKLLGREAELARGSEFTRRIQALAILADDWDLVLFIGRAREVRA